MVPTFFPVVRVRQISRIPSAGIPSARRRIIITIVSVKATHGRGVPHETSQIRARLPHGRSGRAGSVHEYGLDDEGWRLGLGQYGLSCGLGWRLAPPFGCGDLRIDVSN